MDENAEQRLLRIRIELMYLNMRWVQNLINALLVI